jgi:glycerate-2-kinase
MATAARAAGYRTVSVEEELEGEAEYLGPLLARQLLAELERTPDESVALLGCGGEAVVSLEESGMFSRGGPNQHAALRAAEVISGRRAAALFIDTDGSDGGTELAGGLVDGATARRAVTLDIDLAETLRRRTSTAACRALDAAVRTGHTGTNVNDLFVLIAESGGLP